MPLAPNLPPTGTHTGHFLLSHTRPGPGWLPGPSCLSTRYDLPLISNPKLPGLTGQTEPLDLPGTSGGAFEALETESSGPSPHSPTIPHEAQHQGHDILCGTWLAQSLNCALSNLHNSAKKTQSNYTLNSSHLGGLGVKWQNDLLRPNEEIF